MAPEPPRWQVVADALRCAGLVIVLLARRELHIDRRGAGVTVAVPDGRRFVVFRDTSRGNGDLDDTVTLAVWFHLRAMPPGSRLRRFLFERESILNTLLYAGFEGYRRKLWMVDPETCDYAGLYGWQGRAAAERYAAYITAVLRPLSVPGSVGFEIVDRPLPAYLAAREFSGPSALSRSSPAPDHGSDGADERGPRGEGRRPA
jgi:hypothetical protein